MTNKATNLIKLGRRIFYLRREKGFSQNTLAEKLSVSREHLAKVETAKRLPSLGLLLDICEILEINLKDLFDFTN